MGADGADSLGRVFTLALLLSVYAGGGAQGMEGRERDARTDEPRSNNGIPNSPLPPHSSAGVYQAWQAVTVERHSLPAAEAHQVAVVLAGGAPAAAAAGARGLCATRLSLHCTLLPGEPSHQQPAVDMRALAEAHLQPALLQLADAQVSSSVLRHPPPLPAAHLRRDAQQEAHVLPAAAAAVWGQQVRELAWSASLAHADGGGQQTAAVLLYVPPAQYQPLLLEQAGGGGGSSMELADGSLLVVVNQPASGSSRSKGSVEEGLASEILPWLLAPLQLSSQHDSSAPGAVRQQLRRSLAAACAAEAATALQRFVNVTAAVTDQPVTAAAGRKAARAVQLLQAVAMERQQQQEQRAEQGSASAAQLLAAAQGAWMAAQQLLQDPDTGSRPVFPPEHALAVLLPLALPITLVLVQAAGREAAAWKKRRRQQQGEQQGEQQEATKAIEAHTE